MTPSYEQAERIRSLRVKGKLGQHLMKDDMKFLRKMAVEYPEFYDEAGQYAFEATKPYGSI